MKQRIVLFFTIFLIILASCSNSSGLFYSIEQERLIDDNNLNNELRAGAMAVFGDDFVLAAGVLYDVDISDNADYVGTTLGNWGEVDYALDATKGHLCFNTFILGSTLYSLQFNDDVDIADFESQLYSYNDITSAWDLIDDSSNTLIEDGSLAGNYFYYTSYELDENNDRTYKIGRFDGTNFVDLLADVAVGSYFDAATDDTNIYISYGKVLYSGTGTTFVASTTTGLTDDESITGIHYSPANTEYYAATDDGIIWNLISTTWTEITEISDNPRDFGEFSNGTLDYVLLGTEDGYYERVDGAGDFETPTSSTDGDNYQTLSLYTDSVESFYFHDSSDDDEDVLFALTAGYGLWSLRETDTVGVWEWNQE